MTHSNDKAERSRQRSEQHQSKDRLVWIMLGIASFCYLIVPILWHGAIEYGWIHAPTSEGFKSAVHNADSPFFWFFAYTAIRASLVFWRDAKKEYQAPQPTPDEQRAA